MSKKLSSACDVLVPSTAFPLLDLPMRPLTFILTALIFLPSSLSLANLTYVLSHTTTNTVKSYLGASESILTNASYVKRLSALSNDLIASTQTLLSSSDIQSIVFTWNTGDCSYPLSLARTYSTKYLSSPICMTSTSLAPANVLQLTVTSKQLAQAADAFMTRYSLHYFSMILSDSNEFYNNLAEQFAGYLSANTFIYERLIAKSNFSAATITSLKSRSS